MPAMRARSAWVAGRRSAIVRNVVWVQDIGLRAVLATGQIALRGFEPIVERAGLGPGQLAARRMGRGRRGPGDDLKKAGAVTLELGRADARDPRKGIQRLRPALGHFDQ